MTERDPIPRDVGAPQCEGCGGVVHEGDCPDETDDFDDEDEDYNDTHCTCATFKLARDEDHEIICPWCGRPR